MSGRGYEAGNSEWRPWNRPHAGMAVFEASSGQDNCGNGEKRGLSSLRDCNKKTGEKREIFLDCFRNGRYTCDTLSLAAMW